MGAGPDRSFYGGVAVLDERADARDHRFHVLQSVGQRLDVARWNDTDLRRTGLGGQRLQFVCVATRDREVDVPSLQRGRG